MNLSEMYTEAKRHKEEHKSCGGEPYKSYEKLFEVINNFGTPVRVLEIGTAVGFTTCILQNRENLVDTIEFHCEHIAEARKNILKWGGDVNKIDFLEGDAAYILEALNDDTYDIIFFDGYGIKNIYYPHFERLIKKNGILITANRHLKSTESEFFLNFSDTNEWKLEEEFDDTLVYRKLF